MPEKETRLAVNVNEVERVEGRGFGTVEPEPAVHPCPSFIPQIASHAYILQCSGTLWAAWQLGRRGSGRIPRKTSFGSHRSPDPCIQALMSCIVPAPLPQT